MPRYPALLPADAGTGARAAGPPRLVRAVEDVPDVLLGQEALEHAPVLEEDVPEAELLEVRHHEVEVGARGQGEGRLVHPGPQVERRARVGEGLVGEEGLRVGAEGARGLRGGADVVRQLGAGDVAEQDGLAGVGYDGEAPVGVGLEDGV